MVDIADLKGNPKNPNRHGDKQIALLAKIIRQSGWRAPITVSTRSGLIVKGHGRLDAARLLQTASVPVDFQDYESAEQETADMVADNRIAELADMDNSALKDILQDLDSSAFDMELTGFDELSLEGLMTQTFQGSEDEKEIDLDAKSETKTGNMITCPKCGFEHEVTA